MSDGVFTRDRDNSRAVTSLESSPNKRMTPEPLKLWSSFLSLQTTPQSEQICYRNFAAQHLCPEHWSLHFILLGIHFIPQGSFKALFSRALWYLFTSCYHFKFVSLLFPLGTNVEFGGKCQTMLHLYTFKSHLSFLSSFLPLLFLPFLLYYGNEASAQTTIPAYNKHERSTGTFSGVGRINTFLATSIENVEIKYVN